MADFSAVNAAVTVLFGALAGGTTNAVAIWMLFHPYEPRGPRPLKIQGAIPKNKARLAKTIGRTVGQRLLSPEDLSRQLSNTATRGAFDDAVRGFVTQVLDTERRSLRDELPAGVIDELETILDAVADALAARVGDWATSEQFRPSVEQFFEKAHRDLADRPVSDVLTDARREAIRDRVERWVADASQSPELERTIRSWMDRQTVRLAGDPTPLLDRLPPDLVAAVEQEMAGYLPVALDRLARLLRDRESRGRIQRALHKLFEGYVKDLVIHERIVARLVVTEKTLSRLLDKVDEEGVDQLTSLLDEPQMRAQVAKSINDAVVNFLRRPLAEHFQRLGPDRVAGIADTAAGHIVAALRDESTRGYAIEQLDRALLSAEQRTWGDILKYLPPDRASGWLADLAQTPRLKQWLADAIRSALHALVDRPIGRPADVLPEGTVDRLSDQLAPALWQWVQEQIPDVMSKIDVQGMVEHKVLGFSLERIEQIVRATTQRELDLIVRLGYVLGAFVGAVAYGVSLILP